MLATTMTSSQRSHQHSNNTAGGQFTNRIAYQQGAAAAATDSFQQEVPARAATDGEERCAVCRIVMTLNPPQVPPPSSSSSCSAQLGLATATALCKGSVVLRGTKARVPIAPLASSPLPTFPPLSVFSG
ncbi:hypothetical protein MRX96_028766 [Rhipicephalus microplus]